MIGDLAPDFTLSGLDETTYRLSQQRGRIVVINFWSAECRWSERADEILAEAMKDWGDRVVFNFRSYSSMRIKRWSSIMAL
jgi:hypothetical protein